MGDGTTKRRLFLCSFNIKMDPLVIMGSFSKSIDLFLCDQMPIGHSEFLTDQRFYIVIFNHSCCHGVDGSFLLPLC